MPRRRKGSKKKQTSTSNTAEELVKPEPACIVAQMIPSFLMRIDPSLPHYNEYHQRSIELIKKPFEAPWVLDWDPLEEVGLDVYLKGMLRQEYSPPDGKETCDYHDWLELINQDLPIYQELCWEFHSTYFLKENPEGMDDKDFMRFSLGGVDRQMSLMDFTNCLNIYSPEQMGKKHFSDYIWSGARVSSAIVNEGDFNASKVWKKFSSVSSWFPDHVSYLYMNDIDLRLIHLFLTHVIFHRKENTDKVSLSDLWYLQHIRSKTRVNIPYCVAYYLKHSATGLHLNSPICGGHFVTLIAHHIGVKCDASEGIKEVTLKANTIGYVLYQEAKAIEVLGGKIHASSGIRPAKVPTEQPEEVQERQILDRIMNRQLRLEETVEAMVNELQSRQENILKKYWDELSKLLADVQLQLSSMYSRIGCVKAADSNFSESLQGLTTSSHPPTFRLAAHVPQPQPQSGKQLPEIYYRWHRQQQQKTSHKLVKHDLQHKERLMEMIAELQLYLKETPRASQDDLSFSLADFKLELSILLDPMIEGMQADSNLYEPQVTQPQPESGKEQPKEYYHQGSLQSFMHNTIERIVKRYLQQEKNLMTMIEEIQCYQNETLKAHCDDLSSQLAGIVSQLSRVSI